ncbi:EAL domain-containing protein [Cellulomonas sp. 73-92]|uniref:putative bifunctional diguanylate cyclase/phosphodiesterase n=1 Tax=Cellulomonas sp. 73-92 TaxID=1895740 RepID=UPI000A8B1FB8|nr:EAL domain-containing protein [Cellulomonas sp. 73-92]
MPRVARRRLGLTRYFVMVSLVSVVALGLALVWVSSSVMRQQAVRLGTVTATSVSAYAVAPVTAEEFRTGILDQATHAAVASATAGFKDKLVELRLWSSDGRLMYSTAENTTTGLPDTTRYENVRATGQPDARLITDVRSMPGGQALASTERPVLDVYVPVKASDTASPDTAVGTQPPTAIVGAAEVMIDQAVSQQALADAVRTVTLVVVAGLALLWLLLFRTVHTTSRRLQSTALENARLALLDSLTGLPNRRLLADRMRRGIEQAQAEGTRVGLVLLDIDRFKDINDTLGHDRGDELLEQVADRMRDALRDEDIVARLGGDEFAVLLPDVRTVANAERLAQRIRSLFATPFRLGGMELHVEPSVGVACLPDHAADASSLMRTADVAMYSAKVRRTGVAVYDPDEDHSSPARLELLGDLHRALDEQGGGAAEAALATAAEPDEDAAPDEVASEPVAADPVAVADDERMRQLEMYYQPKVDLASGRIVGLEALVRWRHPVHGMLLPSSFIPLAEQSGLIHVLTAFALRESVRQLAQWRTQGRRTPVAVNLSAHDVSNGAVVDLIERLLAEYEVPSSLLQVEITETALIADTSRVVPVLERLGALGVKVAIDDFGIGNTSIAQLRELPVSVLKIDRLFVSDLHDDNREGSQLVVQAMVDLAHSFGLHVVAEGVEDADTAAILARLGVDQAQGFFYAHPSPAGDVADARRRLVRPRRSGVSEDEPAPTPPRIPVK